MHYYHECDAIFVLDNESYPTSAADIASVFLSNHGNGVNAIHIDLFSTGGKFDTAKKQAELMRKKRECVGKFDYVMLLDCDEFISPKAGGRIKDHLGIENVYATHGWNMYGYPGDPIYDPLIPLTQQRKRGIENEHYAKPVIIKPEHFANYSPGCHFIQDIAIPQVSPHGKALFNLLHYRGFDEEVYVRRSLERTGRIDIGNTVDGPSPRGYYWRGDADSFRLRYRYERDTGKVVQVIS